MASRTSPKPGVTQRVPLSELSLYHRNPRRGDVKVIKSSLAANGQYKPIVANIGTHTGRAGEVLAGNHTLMAARDLAEDPETGKAWATILVHWVDVDDDRAARIVVADNRTSEVGGFDHEELWALVEDFGSDLDGTGYGVDDLEELAKLAGAMDDEGAPGSGDLLDPPGEDKYDQQFAVTVICDDEAEQQEVFERLRDEGLNVKVVTV